MRPLNERSHCIEIKLSVAKFIEKKRDTYCRTKTRGIMAKAAKTKINLYYYRDLIVLFV